MTGMPRGPALATDCVLFDAAGRVLLIRRKFPPFKGAYALPGGFVDAGETVEDACRRELREETGIGIGQINLVGVWSDPERDPRSHVVSVVFWTEIDGAKPKAGDDARSAKWVRQWRRARLAFDHAEILEAADALRRAAGRARDPG